MQYRVLTAIVVSLFAGTGARGASEHRHPRAKERTAVFEKLQNSNAYAAPNSVVAPLDSSNKAEGAMASGIAGH